MPKTEAQKRASAAYDKRNPDIVAAKAKRWRLKHLDRERLKAREYAKSTQGRTYRAKWDRTIPGWAKKLLHNARTNSKRRGLPAPTIDISWIKEHLKAKCSISGLDLILDGFPRHPQAPSLDRKDNSRPYTPDNTRVVCWAVNMGLGAWGLGEYLRIADTILKFHFNKSV